jgi:hypothetical protein
LGAFFLRIPSKLQTQIERILNATISCLSS